MKKYNLSEIMKAAWTKYHTYSTWQKHPFGFYLAWAWREAKAALAETEQACQTFAEGMTLSADDVTVELHRWTKAGHDRIYINRGRKSDGYYDLKTGKLYLYNSYRYLSKIGEMVKSLKIA